MLRLLRLGLSFDRIVGRLDNDFFGGAVAFAWPDASDVVFSLSTCPNGGEPLFVLTRAADASLPVVAPASSPLDFDLPEDTASVVKPLLEVVLPEGPVKLVELMSAQLGTAQRRVTAFACKESKETGMKSNRSARNTVERTKQRCSQMAQTTTQSSDEAHPLESPYPTHRP